jgi:hypothetical protein
LEFLKIVTEPIMTTSSGKYKRGETPHKNHRGGVDEIERGHQGQMSG